MKIYDIKDRSFAFSVAIVKFVTGASPRRLEHSLFDQLLRAGTSIGANIREGRASSSRKEFIRYYEIALRSANETSYWLQLMEASLDMEKPRIVQLMQESEELSKILAASIMRLKSSMR